MADAQPPQRTQMAQRGASTLQGDFSELCVVRGRSGRAQERRYGVCEIATARLQSLVPAASVLRLARPSLRARKPP